MERKIKDREDYVMQLNEAFGADAQRNADQITTDGEDRAEHKAVEETRLQVLHMDKEQENNGHAH
jgi:hypothetical protein